MAIDPLEHAAALLRAELVLSCETVVLTLAKEEDQVMLQIGVALRGDGAMTQTTCAIDVGPGSTEADRKAAIHAALIEMRAGVAFALSVKGALAGLGPISLPRIPPGNVAPARQIEGARDAAAGLVIAPQRTPDSAEPLRAGPRSGTSHGHGPREIEQEA